MMKTRENWGPDTGLPKKLWKGTVLVWTRAGCTGASLKACLVQRCRMTTMRTTLYHLSVHSMFCNPLLQQTSHHCGKQQAPQVCCNSGTMRPAPPVDTTGFFCT